jgi:hypothetical protein
MSAEWKRISARAGINHVIDRRPVHTKLVQSTRDKSQKSQMILGINHQIISGAAR